MGARHSGREAALQMLFQMEGSGTSADQTVALFWRTFESADPEGKAYADAIVHGVASTLARLDEQIKSASQNWRLERMSRVDRNLLRLATWELMYRLEIPRAVILDEAVEVAKEFGTEESSAFVNGVLDRVANELGRLDSDRA
jgi:N utilization substance protein B